MLSNEELLKPRYKVIADYPFNSHTIGEIIIDPADDDYSQANPNKSWPLLSLPHLFKPLQWWEERDESDLPEYVKADDGQVYKIMDWDNIRVPYVFVDPRIHKGYIDECTSCPLYADRLPATLEEYTAYQSSSNQK